MEGLGVDLVLLSPAMCCPFSENASFVLGTGKLVTPQKRVEDAAPNLCTPATVKSSLDFSKVTVEQLGITPESFVKTPSGKTNSGIAFFFSILKIARVGPIAHVCADGPSL